VEIASHSQSTSKSAMGPVEPVRTIISNMENVKENVEKDSKHSYPRYKALGGIINEKDYKSALDRAQSMAALENKSLVLQAKMIAEESGIALHSLEIASDPRVILYGILRTEVNPGEKYHHSQMGDQQLFAEALRMLEDEDSLKKLIEAHPNIFGSTKNK